MEEAVKAYIVKDGRQLCHVGFLPLGLLKVKQNYVD
jgi:hypothetical protein